MCTFCGTDWSYTRSKNRLLRFSTCRSIKGINLAQTLLENIQEHGLDILNVRAQCYDGASNMSGKYRGVQALIRERVPSARYVHCKSHSLNLALVHSSKVQCVRTMMATVQDIAFAFDYSAKRLVAFDDELANDAVSREAMEGRKKQKTLCETRWMSRADSLTTFKNAFRVMVHALETLQADRDTKASLRLAVIMQFDLIISLIAAQHILSNQLYSKRHEVDMDMIEAVRETKVVMQIYREDRKDPLVWDAIFQEATDIAAEFQRSRETLAEDELNVDPPLDSLCLSLLQRDANISASRDNLNSNVEACSKAASFFMRGANSNLLLSLAKIVKPASSYDSIHVQDVPKKGLSKTVETLNVDIWDKSVCDPTSLPNFSVFEKDLRLLFNTNNLSSLNVNDSCVKREDRCTSGGDGPERKTKNDDRDGPSQLQLEYVKEYYLHVLPTFHRVGEQWRTGLHHADIVFENNFFKRRKTTRGLQSYVRQISKYRMYWSFMYPSLYFEPLSITTHQDRGCVKLHWRVYMCSNLRFFTSFLPSQAKGNRRKDSYDTTEGISTFYVNKDGKIIKHQVDRTMTLDNKEPATTSEKLAAKIPNIIGLAPK